MATQQTENCIFKFKMIHLLKEQILGIGSYGQVCKASCDNLICAAKILDQSLFDPKAQHKTAHEKTCIARVRKFEREIEILRTVKHPNIVQYIGIYQDSVTGIPVLLMELMDENLTKFLAGALAQIPFHTQVNICHDVTQALAFLHSNSIIHRDLSSNNVLLIGDARAKLTGFGMAKLTSHMNGFSASCSLTKSPGSDAYMPPEAVQSVEYTEKLDCFSFGVLIIQILTRKLPNPRDVYKEIITSDQLQLQRPFQKLSEIERREDHISEIASGHPLLSIALDCLKDVDIERPSTACLCEAVSALKDDTTYKESSTKHTRDQELRLLTQQYKASEQARLELEKRLQELKIRSQHSEGPMSLRLIWREGRKFLVK